MKTTTEHIQIQLSPDGYEAYFICDAEAKDDTSLNTGILQALNRAGVVYGIKEEILKDRAGLKPGIRILIAEGVKPVNGTDGFIEFQFIKPAENGKKYYPLNNVLKDQTIAIVHPPGKGDDGITVCGKRVKPKPGKKAIIRAGVNTELLGENPVTVKSKIDGHAGMRNGVIDVISEVTIDGNLDPGKGIVDFAGSLIINGDVASGVRIHVNKDLTINGNIRDAIISANGNIKIKEGFIGQGDGKITSKGNVYLQHVWNQTIIAEGEVHIRRESVGGIVKAGEKIVANDATITGGLLEADREIIIKNLGCGESSQGKVRVGGRTRFLERLAELKKDILHVEKQMKEIQDAILRLAKIKIELGKLPVDQEGIMEKLKLAKASLPDRLKDLKTEEKNLNDRLHNTFDSRIEVTGTVKSNVLIEVNGVRKMMSDDIEGVIYFERNGAIEIEGI